MMSEQNNKLISQSYSNKQQFIFRLVKSSDSQRNSVLEGLPENLCYDIIEKDGSFQLKRNIISEMELRILDSILKFFTDQP